MNWLRTAIVGSSDTFLAVAYVALAGGTILWALSFAADVLSGRPSWWFSALVLALHIWAAKQVAAERRIRKTPAPVWTEDQL